MLREWAKQNAPEKNLSLIKIALHKELGELIAQTNGCWYNDKKKN